MDTVAVKSAEDAFFWGVHLSAAQRDAMDSLVERLVGLWDERIRSQGLDGIEWLQPEGVYAQCLASDETVHVLQQTLHFDRAAKRYGFFLQYLRDALHAEAARLSKRCQNPVAKLI